MPRLMRTKRPSRASKHPADTTIHHKIISNPSQRLRLRLAEQSGSRGIHTQVSAALLPQSPRWVSGHGQTLPEAFRGPSTMKAWNLHGSADLCDLILSKRDESNRLQRDPFTQIHILQMGSPRNSSEKYNQNQRRDR